MSLVNPPVSKHVQEKECKAPYGLPHRGSMWIESFRPYSKVCSCDLKMPDSEMCKIYLGSSQYNRGITFLYLYTDVLFSGTVILNAKRGNIETALTIYTPYSLRLLGNTILRLYRLA